MEKTSDQQVKEKGCAVVSQISQQEFRLMSYNPHNLKTEIFSKLMPEETHLNMVAINVLK